MSNNKLEKVEYPIVGAAQEELLGSSYLLIQVISEFVTRLNQDEYVVIIQNRIPWLTHRHVVVVLVAAIFYQVV